MPAHLMEFSCAMISSSVGRISAVVESGPLAGGVEVTTTSAAGPSALSPAADMEFTDVLSVLSAKIPADWSPMPTEWSPTDGSGLLSAPSVKAPSPAPSR